MRRMLLVLTVAALMTAMMVTPASAENVSSGTTGGVDNSFAVVQSNGDFFFDFGDDVDFGDGIVGLDFFDDGDDIDFGSSGISVGIA